MTKVESEEYLRKPLGPISSRRIVAQETAEEWQRAKKCPMSTAERSRAFWSPNEFTMSIA